MSAMQEARIILYEICHIYTHFSKCSSGYEKLILCEIHELELCFLRGYKRVTALPTTVAPSSTLSILVIYVTSDFYLCDCPLLGVKQTGELYMFSVFILYLVNSLSCLNNIKSDMSISS